MNVNHFEAQQLIDLRYANAPNKEQSLPYLDQITRFHLQLENIFLNPDLFSAAQFYKFPINVVLKYLQDTHAFYIDKYLNEIALMIDRLSLKGPNEPCFQPVILNIFHDFSQELIRHIQEEERELFPYVNSLLGAMENGDLLFIFNRKLSLMNHLLHHSDETEKRLNLIINLLENKINHIDNSFGLNVLITKLRIFERDLIIHSKLEDEVLLPRAIELENILTHHSDINC